MKRLLSLASVTLLLAFSLVLHGAPSASAAQSDGNPITVGGESGGSSDNANSSSDASGDSSQSQSDGNPITVGGESGNSSSNANSSSDSSGGTAMSMPNTGAGSTAPSSSAGLLVVILGAFAAAGVAYASRRRLIP